MVIRMRVVILFFNTISKEGGGRELLASNLNLEVAKNRFFFLGWLRTGTVHYGCEIVSEGESLFL